MCTYKRAFNDWTHWSDTEGNITARALDRTRSTGSSPPEYKKKEKGGEQKAYATQSLTPAKLPHTYLHKENGFNSSKSHFGTGCCVASSSYITIHYSLPKTFLSFPFEFFDIKLAVQYNIDSDPPDSYLILSDSLRPFKNLLKFHGSHRYPFTKANIYLLLSYSREVVIA